jgi:hypothetical protein
VNSKQVKIASATIGATAAIAMGALGVAFSSVSSAEEPTPGPQPTPSASTGQTSTSTTAPPTVATPQATPSVTGTAPLPTEEQGLPG